MSKKFDAVKEILRENTKGLILSLLWLAFLISVVIFLIVKLTAKTPKASNFEECAQLSGSRILESYPERCIMTDGQSFTRELSEEEQKNLLPPR